MRIMQADSYGRIDAFSKEDHMKYEVMKLNISD